MRAVFYRTMTSNASALHVLLKVTLLFEPITAVRRNKRKDAHLRGMCKIKFPLLTAVVYQLFSFFIKKNIIKGQNPMVY